MAFTRVTDVQPLLKLCMYDQYELDGAYMMAKKERFHTKTKDVALAWVKSEMETNPLLKKETLLKTLKSAIKSATKSGPVEIVLRSYANPMFWCEPYKAFKLTEDGDFTTYEDHVQTLPAEIQPPTTPCDAFHEGVRLGDLVSRTSVCDVLAAHIGGDVEVYAKTKLTYAYPGHQDPEKDSIVIEGYHHGDTESKNIYSIGRCDVILRWFPHGITTEILERHVKSLISYGLLNITFTVPIETTSTRNKKQIYKYLLGHIDYDEMAYDARDVYDALMRQENGDGDYEDETCDRVKGYSCLCRFCEDRFC